MPFPPAGTNRDRAALTSAVGRTGVDLQASYMTHPNVDKLEGYSVYGACGLEVELDVLTGQHVVRRADIFEDTGLSLNPDIDVGQVISRH